MAMVFPAAAGFAVFVSVAAVVVVRAVF